MERLEDQLIRIVEYAYSLLAYGYGELPQGIEREIYLARALSVLKQGHMLIDRNEHARLLAADIRSKSINVY